MWAGVGCEPGIQGVRRISILGKIFGGRPGPSPKARGVWLGVFGKHPGWNDHIDDIGLETETLVRFKSLVYLEGIGARVDSGAWDMLKVSERLEGFDHWILQRLAGECVVARLWSSTDGKGRSKYPMIVAANVVGFGLEWCERHVFEELERLRTACTNATTSQQVIEAANTSRGALRRAMESDAAPATVVPEAVVPSGHLNRLASEMGGEEGMVRVMYHLEREGGGGGKGGLHKAVAMRVPRCAATAQAACAAWLRGVLLRVGPTTPVVVMGSENQGFVDVVVGAAMGTDMFALRASTSRIALTSEIPYSIDAEFASRVRDDLAADKTSGQRVIGAAGDGGASPKSGGLRGLALVGVLAVSAAGFGGENQAMAQPSEAVVSADQPSGQEPRARFNNELRTLESAVNAPGVSDEHARVATRAFVDRVREIEGGVAYLTDVAGLLTTLERLLDGKEPDNSREDVSALGPASTGIYRAVRLSATRVRFEPLAAQSAAEAIEFERLASTGSYLAVTELSVAQALGVLKARRLEDAWRELNTPVAVQDDAREGLRTWGWSATRAGASVPVVSSAWFGAGLRNPWEIARMIGATDIPAPTPLAPSGESPMQQVALSDALLIASAMGCRLPNVSEWRAARGTLDAPSTQRTNLRDASLEKFEAAVNVHRSQGGRGSALPLATAGSFDSALEAIGHGVASDGVAQASDDGVAWLAPVGVKGERGGGGGGHVSLGDGAAFVHLVGNVAEFVMDDSEESASGDGEGRVRNPELIRRGAEAIEVAARVGTRARIIGASALSPSGVNPDDARPIPEEIRHMAFSDVGMRLAFSTTGTGTSGTAGAAGAGGGGGTLARRIARAIEPLPLLKRR